eukprot:gene16674-11317_t
MRHRAHAGAGSGEGGASRAEKTAVPLGGLVTMAGPRPSALGGGAAVLRLGSAPVSQPQVRAALRGPTPRASSAAARARAMLGSGGHR